MRACEGCRKRKIKCDSATTNQWPCAACVRLKVHCVPPTLNYDRAHSNGGHLSGLERVLDFDNSGSSDEDYSNPIDPSQSFEFQGHPDMHGSQAPYSAGLGPFTTPPYTEKAYSQNEYSYDDISAMPLHIPDASYRDENSFHSIDSSHGASLPTSSSSTWTADQYSAPDISDVLGELKINENGVGMYNDLRILVALGKHY